MPLERPPFTFAERVGQLFTIESGGLSLLAVTFILCFAFVRWLRKCLGPETGPRFEATDSSLFLNLMLADFIHSLGGLPNIKWMIESKVTDGGLCVAQGVLKHVGIVGVAMSNFAIALHTFSVLVLRWRPGRHSSKFAVLAVWTVIALLVGVPNAIHSARRERFYGPVGFWCWVHYEFKAEQLTTMYLWCWVSAFAMLVLYTLTFLSMRGWVNFDGFLRLPQFGQNSERGRARREAESSESEEDARIRAIARLMLYFPAIYIATIVPNSVARWMEFDGHKPPSWSTLFVNFIFTLSGFVNFILFLCTRPRMVIGERITIVMRDSEYRRSLSRSRSRSRRPFSAELPLRFVSRHSEAYYPRNSTNVGNLNKAETATQLKNDD